MPLSSWWESVCARCAGRSVGQAARLPFSNKIRRRTACATESLEPRLLLSVSALLLDTTLEVTADGADNVTVRANAGGQVEILDQSGLLPLSPNVAASAIQSIVIAGSDSPNVVDLGGVTVAQFTSLSSIVVTAGDGADSITGSPDFGDSLFGGDGNDTIFGQGENDTLDGGNGDDSLDSSDGTDSVLGSDGADVISAGNGNDTILGGNGNDSVNSGTGDDSVVGENGDDAILADAGNDTINGDGGVDAISGGDGNDSILGGESNDSLSGDSGNDRIDGQGSTDILAGNHGNDAVSDLTAVVNEAFTFSAAVLLALEV